MVKNRDVHWEKGGTLCGRLNLTIKNDERMRAIQKFTLMDDTFMTQVFAGDTECTQELLHIILHRADLRVTRAVTQLTIGNLFGRSVRLDIYAVDEAGRQYDIEEKSNRKIKALLRSVRG